MLPPSAASDHQWLGAYSSRELLVLPFLQSDSADRGLGASGPSLADRWLCLSCCIPEKQKKTRKIWDHSETSSIQVSRLPASWPPPHLPIPCTPCAAAAAVPSWALPGLLGYSCPPRVPPFFGPSVSCKRSHLGRQLGSSCLTPSVNLAWLTRGGGRARGLGQALSHRSHPNPLGGVSPPPCCISGNVCLAFSQLYFVPPELPMASLGCLASCQKSVAPILFPTPLFGRC